MQGVGRSVHVVFVGLCERIIVKTYYYNSIVAHLIPFTHAQIEVINDRIGMVYSGMGPDFR